MMSPAKVLQWLTHVLRPGSCIHSSHLVPCSHVQPLRPLLPPPSLQPQGLSTCCASCHRCPLLSPRHASSSSSSFRSQLFPASLHHVPCNTSDLGTSSEGVQGRGFQGMAPGLSLPRFLALLPPLPEKRPPSSTSSQWSPGLLLNLFHISSLTTHGHVSAM